MYKDNRDPLNPVTVERDIVAVDLAEVGGEQDDDEVEGLSSTINDYLLSKTFSVEYCEKDDFINYRNEPLISNLMLMNPNHHHPDGAHLPSGQNNLNNWGGEAHNSLFSAFSLLHCKSCNPSPNFASAPEHICTCKTIFNPKTVTNCQLCKAPKGIQWYNKKVSNGQFIKICRSCWQKDRKQKPKPLCGTCKKILVGKAQISSGFCISCMPQSLFLVAGTNPLLKSPVQNSTSTSTTPHSPLHQSLNLNELDDTSSRTGSSIELLNLNFPEDSGSTAVSTTSEIPLHLKVGKYWIETHITPTNILDSETFVSTAVPKPSNTHSTCTKISGKNLEKSSQHRMKKKRITSRDLAAAAKKLLKNEKLRTCNKCGFSGTSNSTVNQWYKDNTHKYSNTVQPPSVTAYICNTCYSRNIRTNKSKKPKLLVELVGSNGTMNPPAGKTNTSKAKANIQKQSVEVAGSLNSATKNDVSGKTAASDSNDQAASDMMVDNR